MPQLADPTHCNGERQPPTLAGCNFNLDRFNRERHAHLIATAPADLMEVATKADLAGLDYACSAAWSDAAGAGDLDRAARITELHRRVLSERDRRGMSDAFKARAAA